MLLRGDCLDLMKTLPDRSIDMVLADIPYGTTACKWDVVIPFEPMWAELKRVTKENAAICLFGSEPFSTKLRASNLEMYKYDWIWLKSRAMGFMNAKLRPMARHELISVFSTGKTANRNRSNMKYNPQGLVPYNKMRPGRKGGDADNNGHRFNRPCLKETMLQEYTNYPTQTIEFKSEPKPIHPTQKPVALLEYLIKTYTNEGETVFDFTAGSMSTAVAAINTKREFIMIEKDDHYFEVGSKRVADAFEIAKKRIGA